MKKRWILNLIMLVIVAGLVSFLYLKPKNEVEEKITYEVSQLKLVDINGVKIDFPAKAPVSFEKNDGYWYMSKPYKQRADQRSVQRILSIIAAKSEYKLPATDLGKFGLENPLVRLTMQTTSGEELFSFGTYNSVTEEQYIAYKDQVYLLSAVYSEAASTQPVEMVDKNSLAPAELKQIAGFDFSHLEQWESSGLKVNLDNGKWEASIADAKVVQNDLNEWLEFSWKQNPAKSVELYTPDRTKTYPSFKVILEDGGSIQFDKLMESPDLVIARPDEGLIYRYPNDVGFTMLNPPLNIKQ
jgi:uncharacterized protein DUF4340